MTIRALMMDVDGVLVRGRPADRRPWHAALETDLGVSYERLIECFFKPHWSEIVSGRAPLRGRLTPVLATIAPHLSVDRLVEYWFAMDAGVDAALLEELTSARRAGFAVHLATNQEPERGAYLWRVVGLGRHFDGFHFSADLGVCKPEAAFFKSIIERTGFAPHEVVLVDDAPANVARAREAGWRALLWTGRDRLAAALDGLQSSSE